MANLNIGVIRVAVAKDRSGAMKKAATQRATQVFDAAVEDLQDAFDQSPVTQEIEQGPEGPNLSNTLVGGKERPTKNLFSFIGFNEGDKPISAIRERLSPLHPQGPRLRYEGKTQKPDARFIFRVNVAPTKEAIFEATPMPWGQGSMSWAKKIETNIPGFQFFLSRKGDPNSRSGGGIQVDNVLRPDRYTPPEKGYIVALFNQFIIQINTYNKAGFKRKPKKEEGDK